MSTVRLQTLRKSTMTANHGSTEPAQPEKKGVVKLLNMEFKQFNDKIKIKDVQEIASVPPGLSKDEKRNISDSVPVWD